MSNYDREINATMEATWWSYLLPILSIVSASSHIFPDKIVG
jgi:hypothetical protein